MARLFISYHPEEEAHAFAIRQWLVDAMDWRAEDIFVDVAGIRAEETSVLAAETAEATLLIASEAALRPDSPCLAVLRRARGITLAVTIRGLAPNDPRLAAALPQGADARPIQPVDGGAARPFPLTSPRDGSTGTVELDPDALEGLGRTLSELGLSPHSYPWTVDSAGPYRGPTALQEGDEALLGGRDRETWEVIHALEQLRRRRTSRALVIHGPSGVGKSSLLRAGVWRRLRRHAGFLPLAIIRARHGALSHPGWGLAAGLGHAEANLLRLSPSELETRTRNGLMPLLVDLEAAGGHRTLLLGIDQAEELGDLDPGEAEQLEPILTALREDQLNLKLVLTVRDDSVDAVLSTLADHGLSAEQTVTWRLHRMSSAGYRQAIDVPAEAARRAGYPMQFSDGLAPALAAAAHRTELPILGFALRRLTQDARTADGTIDLAPDRAAAFLRDCVGDAATKALEQAGQEQEALHKLLAPLLASKEGTARTTWASALFAEERAALRPLADSLVRHGLLTSSADSFELAHAALRPVLERSAVPAPRVEPPRSAKATPTVGLGAVYLAHRPEDAVLTEHVQARLATSGLEIVVDLASAARPEHIVPVLVGDVTPQQLPEPLRERNFVRIRGEADYEPVMGLLLEALTIDQARQRDVARVMDQAEAWAGAGDEPSYLLRGAALARAREHLDQAPDVLSDTAIRFIEASEAAERHRIAQETEDREAAQKKALEAAEQQVAAEKKALQDALDTAHAQAAADHEALTEALEAAQAQAAAGKQALAEALAAAVTQATSEKEAIQTELQETIERLRADNAELRGAVDTTELLPRPAPEPSGQSRRQDKDEARRTARLQRKARVRLALVVLLLALGAGAGWLWVEQTRRAFTAHQPLIAAAVADGDLDPPPVAAQRRLLATAEAFRTPVAEYLFAREDRALFEASLDILHARLAARSGATRRALSAVTSASDRLRGLSSPAARQRLVHTLVDQAGLTLATGDAAAAAATLDEARAVRSSLPPSADLDARVLARLAQLALRQTVTASTAEAYRAGAAAIQRTPTIAPPTRLTVAEVLSDMTEVLRRAGDPTAAEASRSESLAIASTLLDDPTVASRRIRARALYRVGAITREENDPWVAERTLREGVEVVRALVASDPLDLTLQRDLARMQVELGRTLLARADPQAAGQLHQAAVEALDRLIRIDPANLLWRRDLADALRHLGTALTATGDREAAQRAQTRAAQIDKRAAP